MGDFANGQRANTPSPQAIREAEHRAEIAELQLALQRERDRVSTLQRRCELLQDAQRRAYAFAARQGTWQPAGSDE